MTRCLTLLLAFTVLPCLSGAFAADLSALTRPQDGVPHRESSAHEDLHKNGDARSIQAGETLVLGELEGPGVITHIWCTVGMEDPFYASKLVVRMYWDGAAFPSVEAPLGDFFGVGLGAWSEFDSEPVSVTSRGRARNCVWQMPFKTSARITVTNDADTECDSFYYYLDWKKCETLPDDTLYFHAQYRQAMPATPGDYVICETEGRGHYVGTVYSTQMVELGWFGEGDDRFYIDGEDMPSLRGTGTEDYFCDAWGFRQFSRPYYGVSLWEGYFPGDRCTAYRWHLPDPVSFEKSLKMSIEHHGSVFTDMGQHLGQFIERPDWISSVGFWYQTPAVGPKTAMPPVDKRLAPYKVIPAGAMTVRTAEGTQAERSPRTVAYMPMRGDGWLEFDFELEEAGRYQISALIIHSVFSGVYQPMLDGQPLGQVRDFNQTGQDPVWVRFDLHELEAGTHTLRFEGRGESPNKRSMAPPVFAFGMDYLILLRLEDMAGYHEAMGKQLEAKGGQ